MPRVSEAVEIGSYLRPYLHIVFETDHRHAGEPCEKAGTYHLIGNVKDVRKNDARQPRMTEKGDALVVWLHRLIKASVVSAVAVPLDQTVHPVGHVLKAGDKTVLGKSGTGGEGGLHVDGTVLLRGEQRGGDHKNIFHFAVGIRRLRFPAQLLRPIFHRNRQAEQLGGGSGSLRLPCRATDFYYFLK